MPSVPVHHVVGALLGITAAAAIGPFWLSIAGGALLWAAVALIGDVIYR